MRNTLILIGQIHTDQQHGLDPYHAVVEATVQRARPVILTGARRRARLHSPYAVGEQRLGRQVTGVAMPGGDTDWTFGRSRGRGP